MNIFVPGPGKLGLNPAGGPAADVARARRPAFAAAQVRVQREGGVRVRLKLSSQTEIRLRRRHKLTLSVRLSFTPRTGPKIVRTRRFTLVLPKCAIFRPSKKRRHGHIVPVPHACTVKL
jgi:hypothetical protein